MAESKSSLPSCSSPISWWASHAMEFDLAAARRVLNQIPRADSPGGCVSQEPAHHVQLVVAGPYLLSPLASGLVVFRLHDLGVVLDDVGQPVAGQDLLPEVVGLEAVGVRRIARAVVPSPVEGQEP